MAGSWCAFPSLALCVWICALCHAVPQWNNLPQNPQTLMFQQTDQRFQQQARQQFPQQVQQQARQQTPQQFQQQASQQFLVQEQASQQFPQQVQQQASQQIPQQFQQSVQQQASQWFPQSVQQQASQQFPQPKQPVAQAEPLDKCAVADYEQIQCGPPGISDAECAAINCCFKGQQCYYGKAGKSGSIQSFHVKLIFSKNSLVTHSSDCPVYKRWSVCGGGG